MKKLRKWKGWATVYPSTITNVQLTLYRSKRDLTKDGLEFGDQVIRVEVRELPKAKR